MKIVNTSNRELSEQEIASIKKFRFYTDGVSFACLRERVMVMLADEPSHDPEVLKEAALEKMRQALSEHPDFSVIKLRDGRLLLYLDSCIFAFTENPCFESFAVCIALREECLDAAYDMEVLAVAYEED